MNKPTPEEIKKARKDAGLSQTKAAELIYKKLKTWQNWEAPINSDSHREMDPAFFELFRIKSKKN